jgi:hypothetical protein
MPRQSISYDILIASPSDTASERDVISECIRDWNSVHAHEGVHCRDVRWELDSVPAFGERSQAIVNKQLVENADVLIGIFKARFGSATGVAQSGTIEEIERFVESGKPVMLYFSNGAVPRDHDAEQLQLVKDYQHQIKGRSIYGEFSDLDDLRRKVNRHLGATMATIGGEAKPSKAPTDKNDLARVFIRSRRGQRSGDVNTVHVSAVLENLSQRRKITDYVCTISVPRACLTHSSTSFMGEVHKEGQENRRFFRRSSADPGSIKIIFQGDKVSVFSLDLGVDQLRLAGTYLAGDYEGTLGDKVIVDAVVEGEILHVERTVADIFENPRQG